MRARDTELNQSSPVSLRAAFVIALSMHSVSVSSVVSNKLLKNRGVS